MIPRYEGERQPTAEEVAAAKERIRLKEEAKFNQIVEVHGPEAGIQYLRDQLKEKEEQIHLLLSAEIGQNSEAKNAKVHKTVAADETEKQEAMPAGSGPSESKGEQPEDLKREPDETKEPKDPGID